MMITASHINTVLHTVTAITQNGDEQLNILIYALVAAAKSCDVDEDQIVTHLQECFEKELILVPLKSTGQ